jgi:hypothetical protein
MKVVDNFFEQKDAEYVYKYCLTSSYTYGETDTNTTPPTGMVHEIKKTERIYKLLKKRIQEVFENLQNITIYRMYVNCFAPTEKPYFHTDGDKGITFLYYANSDWQLDDGGETQIIINNEIKGILPIPNRLVGFDANLVHKATTFRNKHRFTIAIKITINDD